MSSQYDGLIVAVAGKHGVDPYLVKAIIAAESNFNAKAYRSEPRIEDASYGLMQVLAGTAKWMGYTGPEQGLYDPEINVEVGTKFLRYLLDHFNGDMLKAISGYNTGPGNVRQAPDGTFTNQAYVSRVLQNYRRFKPQSPTTATPSSTAASSPTRFKAGVARSAGGEIGAALEGYLPADAMPYVVAGVVALGLVVLTGQSSRGE